jgi:hypothetical protein
MELEFERHRIDKIPKDRLMQELEHVAELNGYVEFGKRDFARLGRISAGPVVNTFGTWSTAIDELRCHLQSKGKDLKQRRKFKYTEPELLSELNRIWFELGHRPSRIEWESAETKYSYNVYKQRFGGWTKACLALIEWKQGSSVAEDQTSRAREAVSPNASTDFQPLKSRCVPLGIRLKVLKRDCFRCVYCGRSPATSPGVELHLDHVIPFANGGESTEENLQTLCKKCNLGKGKSQNG